MRKGIGVNNISGYKINNYPFKSKDNNNQFANYLYMQIKNNLNNYKIYKNIYNPKDSLKNSSSLYSVNNSRSISKNKIKTTSPQNFNNRNKYQKKLPGYKTSYSQNSINNKSFDNVKKINGNNSNKSSNNKNSQKNRRKNSSKNKYQQKSPSFSPVPKGSNKKYMISSNYPHQNSQKNLTLPFSNKDNKINKNERVKTPLINNNKKNYKINTLDNLNRLNNSSFIKETHNLNNNNDLSKSINNMKKSKNSQKNLFEKKMMYNNLGQVNKSFQPKNIFEQFKRKNNKKLGNNSVFIGTLIIDEKNCEQDQNNNCSNGVANSQTHNSIKTNDTTNSHIINNNSNNNLIGSHVSSTNNNIGLNISENTNFNLNINCHEINFNLTGIPKKHETPKEKIEEKKIEPLKIIEQKPKIFKGKKIKCMHDISKTGLNGDDKKVNQDSYFIFKNFVQGYDNIFMGVCDGHGYYGHEVSGYIKENLPMDLNHMIKTKKLNIKTDNLTSIIKNVFIMENNSLLRNKQIDSDLSGSTCISVIYTPEKLIIANLGDSRCILGKFINNEYIAQNLSRDHKPTLPEEAERIKKKGGRIHQMRDDDGTFIGPMRVYMKDKEMPGLAMTRSFGDYFGTTAGTISEPEVTEHVFSKEDKFFLLASDGLFEFIQSQEIIDIVKDYYEKNDIVGCCEFLYKESCRKWLKEEEDVIDDITIIMVFLEDYYE